MKEIAVTYNFISKLTKLDPTIQKKVVRANIRSLIYAATMAKETINIEKIFNNNNIKKERKK